jgi:transcriptional regulator with XRE-family HTH domain
VAGYGRLIREAREAEGLSQPQLADKLNVDPSMVSRIENERVRISPELFVGLTHILRTLRPGELIEAMGYPIGLSRQQRKIPRELLDALEEIDPQLLAAFVRLGRGALLEARERYRADRPEPPPHTP